MTGSKPAWFRRRYLVWLASIAGMILMAGGYGIVSAVQEARNAALRSQDL